MRAARREGRLLRVLASELESDPELAALLAAVDVSSLAGVEPAGRSRLILSRRTLAISLTCVLLVALLGVALMVVGLHLEAPVLMQSSLILTVLLIPGALFSSLSIAQSGSRLLEPDRLNGEVSRRCVHK